MIVDFQCPKCEKMSEVSYSLKDGPPKLVTCGSCNEPMIRVWGPTGVVIPDHMKATEEGDGFTHTRKMMEHAPRPSGRERTFY